MKIKNSVLISVNKSKDIRRGKYIIPDDVTSIREKAFLGCNSLMSIEIPDGVTDIGYAAFYYCTSLTNIEVSKDNTAYKSIDGNLYSKDGTVLIQYAIGKTATEFTIPNGVTSIGEWAFSGCNNLESITIPNSVIRIGIGAFSHCKSLTSVIIPSPVTSIGGGAFCGCISLKSIDIPDSVTSIGATAFNHCSNLTSITIPNSVMSIGSGAFHSCWGLDRLIIPKTTKKIKCVKGFRWNGDKLKCLDFIYEIKKTYKEDTAKLCKCGFHACTLGLDVFNYYSGNDVVYYEVELSGLSFEKGDDSKICAKQITLLRELTVAEAANYKSEIVD